MEYNIIHLSPLLVHINHGCIHFLISPNPNLFTKIHHLITEKKNHYKKDSRSFFLMNMTGTGSPCGACKFLRRKCVRGCVFAPYFCHEQGASHFSAIHKVFGASNVSKLLAHLPVTDRCEAAVTISYEAQARLQDPIYGCVSHIFALQQQVYLFSFFFFFFNLVSKKKKKRIFRPKD